MIGRVLILGAGVAGMEVAARLKELDIFPIVIERKSSVGGHLAKWDRLFPGMYPAQSLLETITQGIDGIYTMTDTTLISAERTNNNSYRVSLSNGDIIVVEAIVVATGFTLFNARRKEEYGYGIYDHVITNIDLENFFKTGIDNRVDNPTKIGFVHCVGSRDEKVCNRQCSKVCCITAVKQAIELKERFPKADIFCFYMDLRMFGRGYEDLYLEAQSKYGVRFIRGRVSEVSEDNDSKVIVKAEDTLSSRPVKITLDLLVLMSGIVADMTNTDLLKSMGIKLGEDGFANSFNSFDRNVQSDSVGIFLAGTVSGPKTIPETINSARSSAVAVHKYLKNR